MLARNGNVIFLNTFYIRKTNNKFYVQDMYTENYRTLLRERRPNVTNVNSSQTDL